MLYKILLNDQEYGPDLGDLPCLITYADKVGGSQFTMTILAHLCLGGLKAIVLTAYPMAKENFLQQVEGTSLSIGHIQSSTNIEKNKNADVIFIESGKSDLLLETMNALTDIEERIILIKNFEVFEDHVVESCLSYKMLILSGNIDNSSVKEKVASIHYESIIAFSQPQYALPIAYKQQERYSGYIKKSSIHGTIKLETTL